MYCRSIAHVFLSMHLFLLTAFFLVLGLVVITVHLLVYLVICLIQRPMLNESSQRVSFPKIF